MLPPWDTAMTPLKWKLRMLPGYFWTFFFCQETKKQRTIGLDHQGKIGLKEEYVQNARQLRGDLSTLMFCE